MSKKQIEQKAVPDLSADLVKAREKVSQLKLENSMRKLKNTRSLFLQRKEIARILTKMRMKEVVHV